MSARRLLRGLYLGRKRVTGNMRWNRKVHDPFDGKDLILELLDHEVDRQRADVASRGAMVATRATVLIASASIITSLQSDPGGPAFIATVILTATAAMTGVVVLVMRSGDELSIVELEKALWPMATNEARRDLVYQKLYALRGDEKRLRRRARTLNVGFALLAASLISTAFHLTTTI
jgi:hypothetical protein